MKAGMMAFIMALTIIMMASFLGAKGTGASGVSLGMDDLTPTGMWERLGPADTGPCKPPFLNGSQPDVWHYGHNVGPSCNYDDGTANSGTLTTPSFTSAVTPVLTFWYLINVQDMSIELDIGEVDVSVDGGPFVRVVAVDKYPLGEWRYYQFSLTQCVTHICQLRFYFWTGGDQNNNAPGWYIADFTLAEEATPTPTATSTSTSSPTPTSTSTPTETPTSTPTSTSTSTSTSTATATNTPTPTVTNTSTSTPTNTPTETATPTSTATATSTSTSTLTSTPTSTATSTSTATNTLTPTPTQTRTSTGTPTGTSTRTSTATTTPTGTPTLTPTPTLVPTATATRTFTVTSTNTLTLTPTSTPTASSTPTVKATPTVATPTGPQTTVHKWYFPLIGR